MATRAVWPAPEPTESRSHGRNKAGCVARVLGDPGSVVRRVWFMLAAEQGRTHNRALRARTLLCLLVGWAQLGPVPCN